MSDRPNAVIAGSLAEIKFIKSRSVCVLCVEIPIEQSEDAIAKFGVPIPGREIPIALARLQASPGPAPAVDSGPSTAPSFPKDAGVPARDTVKSERAKAAYLDADEVTRATMDAGKMRNDPRYWKFLSVSDKATAAAVQRMICGVSSNVEFHTNPKALQTFRDHQTSFKIFIGEIPEIRS